MLLFADFGALYKVNNVAKTQIFCTKNRLKQGFLATKSGFCEDENSGKGEQIEAQKGAKCCFSLKKWFGNIVRKVENGAKLCFLAGEFLQNEEILSLFCKIKIRDLTNGRRITVLQNKQNALALDVRPNSLFWSVHFL